MARKRVLIVDDEPQVVNLLRKILEKKGLRVDSAADASTALDLVRENIYDAAIVDFNLPDMNGVMLHRQIRQMDEELASSTLFISGLLQSEQNLGYYNTFGKGFLPKPFRVQQVLDALNSVWVA